MSDQHGRLLDLLRDRDDIKDVVLDRSTADLSVTFAVSGEAQCLNVACAFGQRRHDVFVPTPGRLPIAMNEEDRRAFGSTVRELFDDLERHGLDQSRSRRFVDPTDPVLVHPEKAGRHVDIHRADQRPPQDLCLVLPGHQ